jgi:predicted alpha/beta-fold hydrolase
MTGKTFEPAWWLLNSHLQTLWPSLFRRPIKQLELKRERFELPDGDFVDLDWSTRKEGPIVLILHGFEGSIKSLYAQGMLQAIHQRGWRGVLMHFRSCSGERNRLPRIYHSGETSDVDTVVTALKCREPTTPIAAIGFSLGGNVLLKWLGETKQHNPLTAAVAVSVPFELQKAATRLNKGFSKVYQWHLLHSVRNKIKDKFQHMPVPFPLPSLSTIHSLQDFDDKITAPLHGFIDANDYYLKSSSRPFLNSIYIPTLLLQAKDDPFMTLDLLPEKQELSDHVTMELTEKGGHVGFVSGKFPWQSEYWLEKRIPAYLSRYIDLTNNSNNT